MTFTVYKSSAGSGKTFSLVKEYLKLILPEPDKFRHILAITFTNKVANEMKERVLSNLGELSKNGDERQKKVTEQLIPVLVKETGLDEITISAKAVIALEMILHNYSDFAICTIDSFSHRIIRTFARDFGLPLNFNVEIDSDELFQTAIDLLLDRVGEDAALTDLLVRFLETRMDEERSWNIDLQLMDFTKVLLGEEASQHLDKLKNLSLKDFNRIAAAIYSQIGSFESRIRLICKDAVDLIHNKNIPDTAFYYGNQGISKYFTNLAKDVYNNLEPNSRVRDTIEKDIWTSSKASVEEIRNINMIKGELKILYDRILQYSETGKSHYYLLKNLTKTIFPLTLLNEIEKILDDFKKQNNIVHISEFNKRISAFIMNEPVPFIYERLGEKYHHLMIDEFQDTSVLQWQNLLPLIENSLAYGYFNMVVGDGKQAIYRWRNGDAGQLTSLPSIAGSKRNPVLSAREKILSDQFEIRELDSNFRSKAEIIDFNNHFFAHLRSLMSESNQLVYKHLEQKYKSENTGGYISLEFLEKGEEGRSYKDNTFPRILEIIKEVTSDKFQLKDIAILCRRNRDSSEIARFLAENDIDVISSESLLLSHSPEVNFMVSFLRLFDDPFNIIVKAGVLTFLHSKRQLPESNLDELLDGITSSSSKRDNLFTTLIRYGFNLSPGELGMMALVDFFEEIIRVFSLNIPANPNIQFFLDYVLKFSRKNTASRTGFLEWWDDHKDSLSVIVPKGMDAVNIMTVHKAKGLQFPVVILPQYTEKKILTKPYLWVELPGEKFNGLSSCMLATGKEMAKTVFAGQYEEEEEKSLLDIINILYVAMTRPEERLYIISPVPPVKSANPRSVPEFFKYFLISANRWSDQFMKYEWGVLSIHESTIRESTTIKDGPDAITLTNFISSNWRKKVFIRSSAPESWDVIDPQRSRTWGNLVHTALSKINTRDDCNGVLEEMNLSGLIEESQKEQLSEKILAVLTNPEVSRFFQKGLSVKTEAEILVEDGSVYRPDRVILEGEKAIILDYKTGKPKERYKKQLQTYGKLLREMGFREIQTFLLYVDPEIKLIEVEP